MDEIAIKVSNIKKVYNIYENSTDRLKESFSLSKKKYHRDFNALDGIDITVKKGEILGIMGRNGAGKSTLLKIITGVLSPSEGEVIVNGKVSSLLELGIGFNNEYTGRENIYFYGTLMGLTDKQIKMKESEIIQFAELEEYIDQPIRTYSSGMYARLAFACAINVNPDILIVDEILSVGDMRFQAKCFKKFKDFKKQGVTILYVGHDVSVFRSFCDRAIWLHDGKIVIEGDPVDITAQFVKYMYEGDSTLIYKPIKQKRDKEKPLAQWGTNVGCILETHLYDLNIVERKVFELNEEVIARVVFLPTKEMIDKGFLSVAFSIKNKEGTDVFVKTLYDEGIVIEDNKTKKITVDFRFKMQVAPGEYYTSIGIENREFAATAYYEYIEGANYLKVNSNKRIFGLFDSDCVVEMKCE